MAFGAKYKSLCSSCDSMIEPGELVEYRDDEVVHVSCPDVVQLVAGEVCGKCFMEKSVTGECGCDE